MKSRTEHRRNNAESKRFDEFGVPSESLTDWSTRTIPCINTTEGIPRTHRRRFITQLCPEFSQKRRANKSQ